MTIMSKKTVTDSAQKVSLHFRGPLQLKQFAVYTPSGSSSKKAKRSAHERRHAHGHAHFHQHQKEVREAQDAAEKRAVGDWVTATINGQVVSWANSYDGSSSPATSAAAVAASSTPASSAAPASSATSISVAIKQAVKPSSASSAAASTKASSAASSSSSSSSSGGWTQQAYYNAESGTANGVTFLNHNGGSGSGVFDYKFGNSLSYASADGCSGASSPQVLSNTQLPSNEEIVIMSDKECNDGDCGYVRPGTVAYHGFDGAQKAFFFEFQMPLDGNTDATTNGDMPAIWMLNAQIPNTLQYGQADCSCWTSGCGEFDIFEVLAPGDLRCKSTLHGNVAGGDSDYFARPTGSTIKAVLVMNQDNLHIKVLDDSFDFSSTIDAATINDICDSTLTQVKNLVSLFALSS